MPTHYEVLGVGRDASSAELRSAYLAKARHLHPDRHAGRSPAEVARAQRAMQEVNLAWSVLGDPTRRRTYDQSLQTRGERAAAAAPRPASAARPPTPPPVVLPDHDPHASALPYLVRIAPVALLLGVLATIFVVTAFAAGHDSSNTPGRQVVAPGTPAVGSCVTVGDEITGVPCDDANAMRVERYAVVEECGGGAVPIRWDDRTVLCIRPQS